MAFETGARVRFAHVDAAGIVFYPRYFEMLNEAVEDWFASMDHDFHTLHLVRKIGTPMVSLKCEFTAASVLGDRLTINIAPTHVGRTSCAFEFRVRGDGGDRFLGSGVMVCMDLQTRSSIPWPDHLRTAMIAARSSGQS